MDDFQTRSEKLRDLVFDHQGRKIKLVNFQGTKQSKDTYTVTDDLGRLRFRLFDKFAMHAQPATDFESPRYNCILMKEATQQDGPWKTLCLQMVGCTWRCWYCYVDPKLLSGNSGSGELVTFSEMAELIATDSQNVAAIDLTGGQPDLISEWPLELMSELKKAMPNSELRRIRSEDNLSNDFLWRFLDYRQIGFLAESPEYTRVGCFKGFDPESFSVGSKSDPTGYSQQLEVAARLYASGFDPYHYAVFTGSLEIDLQMRIGRFFDDLRSIVDWLPLRVVPLKLRPTTTWQSNSTTSHKPDAECRAHEIWFDLVERAFGARAFQTELREVF